MEAASGGVGAGAPAVAGGAEARSAGGSEAPSARDEAEAASAGATPALPLRKIKHPPRAGLALVSALAAVFLVVLVVVGLVSAFLPGWALLLLCAGAAGFAAAGAVIGIKGVIRFGIFTEGFGAREIDADHRQASIARAAGTLGEASLFAAVALFVATAAVQIFA